MMQDLFKRQFLFVDGILEEDRRVDSEQRAVDWALQAALSRNKVYNTDTTEEMHAEFRDAFRTALREASHAYENKKEHINDDLHCDIIEKISDDLSTRFKDYSVEGRLRFGTSQKAFNLYLKYLWALGKIPMPPHCPVDSIVLEAIDVDEAWTKCDSRDQYMKWISKIREHLNLTTWEHLLWFRRRLSTMGL